MKKIPLLVLLFSLSASLYSITSQQPSDTISVKSFGARGDGVKDDRVAIQKALDALLPNQVLLIPKTTSFYKVVNAPNGKGSIESQRATRLAENKLFPLTCRQKNVTIVFEGNIKSTSILANLFEFSGENTTLIGSGGVISGPGGKDDVGFLDTNSWEKTQQWHPSLVVIQGKNSSVKNLIVEDPPTCGITAQAVNAQIYDCNIRGGKVNYGTGTVLFGIFLDYGSDNAMVKMNTFSKSYTGGAIYSGVYSVSKNSVITNNVFSDYHEHGVYNYGQNCNISNNLFSCNYAIAADIQNFGEEGSIIDNNSINTYAFIQIMRGSNTIISNNICSNVRGGIYVRKYPNMKERDILQNLVIKNNIININNEGQSVMNGIDIDIVTTQIETIDNIIIENNKISAVSQNKKPNTTGIKVTISKNGSKINKCTIVLNEISGNITYPLILENANNSIVKNNKFNLDVKEDGLITIMAYNNIQKTTIENNTCLAKRTRSTSYRMQNCIDCVNNTFRKNNIKIK